METKRKISRRVPANKVSRACVHCKSAHVTCEAKRPCSRCVKRGLESSCKDAPRKTRKYLMEPSPSDKFLSNAAGSEHEVLASIMIGNSSNNRDMNTKNMVSPAQSNSSQDELLAFQRRNGGSSKNGGGLNTTTMGDSGVLVVSPLATGSPYGLSSNAINGFFENGYKTQSESNPQSDNDNDGGSSKLPANGSVPYQHSKLSDHGSFDHIPSDSFYDTHINQYFIGTMDTMDGRRTYTFPQIVEELNEFKRENPTAFKQRNKRSGISFSIGVLQDDKMEQMLQSPSTLGSPCGILYSTPQEIYSNIRDPFLYVGPYHDLNVYLKRRFSKGPLLQMSKSMAEYRPSFIAGMIRLKEQDLVFAEQCFQRTLLEYNEYISISGTPTIVWRRSSQIAYVSEEFSVLTGWTRPQLLDKSTFVVEIMDDKSCVEYFKLFSKIAFGDFKGATMTECTLLTSQGRGIRTSCTWTLKRDVFGIPMMIIGNFLPILT